MPWETPAKTKRMVGRSGAPRCVHGNCGGGHEAFRPPASAFSRSASGLLHPERSREQNPLHGVVDESTGMSLKHPWHIIYIYIDCNHHFSLAEIQSASLSVGRFWLI